LYQAYAPFSASITQEKNYEQQNEELQASFGQAERSVHYLKKESLTLGKQFAASQSVWQEKREVF